EARLHEPEPAAAVLLGRRDAEKTRVGELLPQLAVEALLARLVLLDTLGRDRPGEDLRGEVAHRDLLLRQLEVHAVLAGLNAGTVSSSSASIHVTGTAMPTSICSSGQSTISATSRVPSSSSMRPSGSG